jgi:hypothetical protein
MGAAFAQMWGEHELSNTSSSNLYQNLGQTYANVSKRMENNVSIGRRLFDNPVEDLITDVLALKEALGKRKAVLFTYTKKLQEAKVLSDQMDKLRASADFQGQQDKYYALEKQIRYVDVEVEELKKQSELVSSRLARDIERFRVEWHERMRQVLEVFHKHHIEFLQKQAMDFSAVLPSLSALESHRSQLLMPLTPVEKPPEISMSYSTGGAKVSLTTIPVDHGTSYPEETTAPPLAMVSQHPAAPPPAAAPPPPPPPESPARNKSFDSVHSISLDVSDELTSEELTNILPETENGDGSNNN